jgi:hypothetical protein
VFLLARPSLPSLLPTYSDEEWSMLSEYEASLSRFREGHFVQRDFIDSDKAEHRTIEKQQHCSEHTAVASWKAREG